MIGLGFLYPGSFVVGWRFAGHHNEQGDYELTWFEIMLGFVVVQIYIGEA